MPSYRLPLSEAELYGALYNGHGRAVQHLRARGDAGLEDELRDAFTFDYRYDLQLEGSRADWLCGMFEYVRDPSSYEDAVCTALNELDHPLSWHTDQLCDLARRFASEGNAAARAALEGAVERVGVGWEQLIALDGADALPGVFALWGRFDWWSWTLMDAASAAIGRDAALGVLESEAQRSEAAARLLEEVNGSDDEDARSWVPKTLQKIEAEIEAGEYHGCIGFGMQASEEDRGQLFRWLLREQRPDQIHCLLRVFRNHKTPMLADRLFELADFPDERIREHSRRALGQWQDDRVRELALRTLDRQPPGELEKSVTELFVRNFRPEVAAVLESRLPHSSEDDHALYVIAGDICEIAKRNAAPELAGCLLWAYEYSPAAICRSLAVRELIRRNALPEDIWKECLDDSFAETRALAASLRDGVR
jgi:hypothetical protein